MDSDVERERLCVRWLAGELDPAEQAQLEHRLCEDPALSQTLLEVGWQAAALVEARMLAETGTAGPRRVAIRAAAAVLVASCAALAAWWWGAGATLDGGLVGGPERLVVPAEPAYVRPKLSETALTESMYYPLDTCVVSGKKLLPHSCYEDLEGRLVRVYSPRQIAELARDPERYLAVIDAAYEVQQAARYPLTVCAATGEPLPEEPVELVMDLRHDYAQKLKYNQRHLAYRYSVGGRLLRFKDEAAMAAFKAVDATGRMAVAEEAMDRYVTAMVEQQRRSYPSKICAVNKKDTMRAWVDQETGGIRYYLLGDQLFILCCKTCLVDMADTFAIMVDAAAWLDSQVQKRVIQPEERNLLIRKKLPDPPE